MANEDKAFMIAKSSLRGSQLHKDFNSETLKLRQANTTLNLPGNMQFPKTNLSKFCNQNYCFSQLKKSDSETLTANLV